MKQNRKEILEENGTGKMCSLSVGETGEMCSSVNADTRGDGLSFRENGQPKTGYSY